MSILDLDKNYVQSKHLTELGFKAGKEFNLDSPALYLPIYNENPSADCHSCVIEYKVEYNNFIRISSQLHTIGYKGDTWDVVSIPYINIIYPKGDPTVDELETIISETRKKMIEYKKGDSVGVITNETIDIDPICM